MANSNPTKEQILEAAATSPEAKSALEKLFPQYFPPEYMAWDGSKTYVSQFPDAVQEFTQRTGVNMRVVNGLATGEAKKHKSFAINHTDHVKCNLVVLDHDGNRVAQVPFDRGRYAFVAIEKVK